MLDAPFTPAELADIRTYQWPRQAWFALSGPVELALSLAWLAWMIRPLYAAAERHADWLSARVDRLRPSAPLPALGRVMARLWSGPGWGPALLFSLYDLLLFRVPFLPVDWYLGFAHERAFGMSTQTAGGFAWDLLKGTSVQLIFTAFLVFGLYGLARRTARWWLLLGLPSALLLLGAAALDPYRSALYFANDPLPRGHVRDAVEATLAKAGVAHADVVVEHTGKATRKLQAYFAGQGPTRRVVLNDALVERLAPEEISAAVAHEAGHIHEPRWPARVASAFAVLAFLWLVARLQQHAARKGAWGMREAADVRGFPAVTTLLLLLTLLASPVAAWVGRRGELEADRYALDQTGRPEAFTSMLVKAARVNKMDPDPPRWLVWSGMSHPPISERLSAVEDWKTAAAGRWAPLPSTP